MLRRLGLDVGRPDPEGGHVRPVLGDVALRDHGRLHALLVGAADDPVVHVGEVLDEHHPESLEGEIAADDIEGQGAPRVSDVREVVDGDPADVHARLARDEGDEVLLATGEGVEDPERHHGTSTLTTAMAAMPSLRPRRPRCSGLLALTLT